jgi:tRNA(Ile)-lysidine synthase
MENGVNVCGGAGAGWLERLAVAWPVERWRDVNVVAAVSGGCDSMALLRGLAELKRQAGGAGRLLAVHVNHQLRGDQADEDERWLIAQCRRLGVPLVVERADARSAAAQQGDGLEAAARQERYRRLIAAAEAAGARYIALGHTRDDQVETVLFRLLRGAGLRGLAGMPATRSLSPTVTLVRPLLALEREEALAYLQAIDQPYREDATNDDVTFARNRVRHELLPYLREHFNSRVDAAIGQLAAHAADACAIIESLAAALLAECAPTYRQAAEGKSAGASLSVAPLAERAEPLVCEALRLAWRQAGLAEQAMTASWWKQLAQFSQSAAAGSTLSLPGQVRASLSAAGVLSLAATSSY